MTGKLQERVEIIEDFAAEITGLRRKASDIEPMTLLTATLMSIGLNLKNIDTTLEQIADPLDER
jgi:hypothetical protein